MYILDAIVMYYEIIVWPSWGLFVILYKEISGLSMFVCRWLLPLRLAQLTFNWFWLFLIRWRPLLIDHVILNASH